MEKRTIIERASLFDMPFLLQAAAQEGWNPGLCDAAPFYYSDPEGFFIEKIQGVAIGSISAVSYSSSYGFIGFYIVLPSFRGKGYGMQLWNHAIDYLKGKTIGLDGVLAQQKNYEKAGFSFYYSNIRFKGKYWTKRTHDLMPLTAVPFLQLAQFDQAIYGLSREIFLQHWISMPQSTGFAKMQGATLLGYGVVRKCVSGYKIGPLFAENSAVATELLEALASSCPRGADLFIDIPETNQAALELARALHPSEVFRTARMYKGPALPQALSKIFAVTTLELG